MVQGKQTGDKCKEMVIDFSKSKQPFDSIGVLHEIIQAPSVIT